MKLVMGRDVLRRASVVVQGKTRETNVNIHLL